VKALIDGVKNADRERQQAQRKLASDVVNVYRRELENEATFNLDFTELQRRVEKMRASLKAKEDSISQKRTKIKEALAVQDQQIADLHEELTARRLKNGEMEQ
jgi:hypothetical protein